MNRRSRRAGFLWRLTLILLFTSAVWGESVLIVNKAAGNVVYVNPDSMTITAVVPVGLQPHEIVVDDAKRYAYVTNFGTNSQPGYAISVIDVRMREEVFRIDTFPYGKPHGIARGGRYIYFTTGRPSGVGRYDPLEDRVDWFYETGQINSHMVLVARENPAKLYVANVGSGTVTSIAFSDDASAPKVRTIQIGSKPEGMALTSDGSELWVGHLSEGRVSVVDTTTDQVVSAFPLGVGPIRLLFTPGDRHLLVSDFESGMLEVVDPETGVGVKSIYVGARPVGLHLSSDGREVWIAVTGDDEIAIVDLATLEITARFHPGDEPDGMAWLHTERRRTIHRP